MKKLGSSLLALAVLLLGGSAFAQQARNSFYYVTYFSNANTASAPDAVLRLVNDGDFSGANTTNGSNAVIRLANDASTTQGSQSNGTLYASIYVFDDGQAMQECCNCSISADGMLSESVNINLTSNTLTGREENTRGVVKIIGGTNPDPTHNARQTGLRGTMTHIQAGPFVPGVPSAFLVTESPLAPANLATVEQQDLEMTCGFVITLGSGYGVCSCTPEDQDF
jgi:hypothetical protein